MILMKRLTAGDVVRRTAVRLGLCAAPYLLVAEAFSYFGDDRLFLGTPFWCCVVAVPLAGFLVDLLGLVRPASPVPVNAGSAARSDRP